MANIPRLRAVLTHNATRSAWIQCLAVEYWPYTTNPRGALLLLYTGYQHHQSSNKCFVITVLHHGFQPISIQGLNPQFIIWYKYYSIYCSVFAKVCKNTTVNTVLYCHIYCSIMYHTVLYCNMYKQCIKRKLYILQ